MTESLFINILLFLYAVVAPGIAVAYVILRERDPVIYSVVGLTIGVLGLPILNFTMAMAFRTHITPVLVIGVSTAILAVAAFIWRNQSEAVRK